MLGGFLALLSAVAFAFETATARRGVVSASVVQALSISVPLGVPIFLLVAWASGSLDAIFGFPVEAILLLSAAGILHFIWGRYCNYRANKAIGSNLAGPIQQFNLLVALVLAICLLGEALTPLRVLGIMLVILGPMLVYERATRGQAPAAQEAAPELAARAGAEAKVVFQPRYAEGYLFALLSSVGYGVSPILVRMALEARGIEFSISGGLISYAAATAVFLLILLVPGQAAHIASVNRTSARWFFISGTFVCIAQMLRYMALAIAPVSVVTPIQRLSLVFRLYFSKLINPDHEVFSSRVYLATALALIGALALTLSVDMVQAILPLPEGLVRFLNWRWP